MLVSSAYDSAANPAACAHTKHRSLATRPALNPKVLKTFSPGTGTSFGSVELFHPLVSVNVLGLSANSFDTRAS